jgi:hypothetical protein
MHVVYMIERVKVQICRSLWSALDIEIFSGEELVDKCNIKKWQTRLPDIKAK